VPAAEADSPWQVALGDEFALLHPRLLAYFSAIPAGRVGRGVGTFDRVGTPRRWVWPVLRLLQRRRILFPVWEHDVSFTIENRPDGAALHAVRTFHLEQGDRAMVDVVSTDGARLVDRLGDGGRLRTRLSATVRDGALLLVSTSSRWGRVPIPFAPRLRLIERFDDVVGRQHVALTLESALVGRVYEYSGHFDYRIESA
jgi:hypothetical protein